MLFIKPELYLVNLVLIRSVSAAHLLGEALPLVDLEFSDCLTLLVSDAGEL